MTTSAKISQYTLLQFEASEGVWKNAGPVRAIGGPSIARAAIDVTTLEDEARTFIGATPDGGELTFDLNFVPSAEDLQDMQASGEAMPWRVVFAVSSGSEEDATVTTATDTVAAANITGGADEVDVIMLSATTAPTSTPQLRYNGARPYYTATDAGSNATVYLTNADAIADENAVVFATAGTAVSAIVPVIYSFTAAVTAAEPSASEGEALSQSVTLKVSGAVTDNLSE